MKNIIFKRIISLVILTIFFIWLGFYIYKNSSDFKKIFFLDWHYLFFMSITYMLFLLSNGYILKIVTNKLGVKINIWEGFYLSIINSFFNLIAPFKGGYLVQAVYMKKKYKFNYTKFVISMAGFNIVLFLVISFLILLLTLYLFLKYQIFNFILTALFILIFLSLLFIIIFTPTIRPSEKLLIKKFSEIIEGWNSLKKDKILLFKLFTASTIYVFMGIVFMFFSFLSIGLSVAFTKVFYLYLVSRLSFVFSITPAYLGIHEAVLVITAAVVSVSASNILLVAFIDRGVGFIFLGLMMGFFNLLPLLERNKSNKSLTGIN